VGDLLAAVTRNEARRGRRSTMAIGLAIVVIVRSLPIESWYLLIAFVTAVLGLCAASIYLARLLRSRPSAPVGSSG
ncbi:MAG: hypothetical protein ACRD1H_19195, partial [Vicinamibacterales bacterium]